MAVKKALGIGDWGLGIFFPSTYKKVLGIGDWGLGIFFPSTQSSIPSSQFPVPNLQSRHYILCGF
ncbi:hypothetical protein SD81_035075 [Tolypothrix campylonemoides VB511288]|nr:hypothetical protein SD81_035075 [Tolypothrix campylonemoides VB511288]